MSWKLRKETSADSAARFFKAQQSRRRRQVASSVPADWMHVEREYPGAHAAWVRQVRQPESLFAVLIVQGGAVAARMTTLQNEYRYENGKWRTA